MARKKRSTSRRRSSRRRMGAVGKSDLMTAVQIIAGAVIGKKVAQVIPFGNDTLKNAVVAGIGVAFPMILKSDLGKGLGNGMIAAGGLGLVSSLNIPGLGQLDADSIEFPVTVGEVPDNISVIAGDSVLAGDSLSVLAGYDEEDGY